MKRCSVAVYLVEVKELHGRTSLKLGEFDGHSNLRDVVQKILARLGIYRKIDLYHKVFRVALDPIGNDGELTGLIHSGDYGLAADIINSDSGVVAYKKRKTDSLTDPFYFSLHLPPKETRGILCLQQFGLSGVKTLFENVLAGQFGRKYPNFRLHIRGLTMTDALVDYVKRGVVEELIVEKHEIPADIADHFGGVKKTYPGKFSYSIKPSRGLFKKSGLLAFAKGEKELSDVFDFGEHGFDVVKTKIRVGDELKPVNLTKPDSISTTFDITGAVQAGQDGYPTKASLAKEFKKIATETAKRGGIAL
ncbi:MAG: hypothetical protein K5872_04610 [Rhizobiaceae bacterium]|nr:hypothetical protein [Rhizobiaceae bacterium]MCV0405492.1 hypothetical protein [Rhizobiaceae bacterium]